MESDPHRKDIVIVGGGIAGITAAVNASMMAQDCVVIEKSPYLGQIPEAGSRSNYPGLRNIEGKKLAKLIEEQAKEDFSVDINRENVTKIAMDSTVTSYRFHVYSDHARYLSKVVIIATGSHPAPVDIPGESLKGVTYYPGYDFDELKGKDVVIMGNGNPVLKYGCWLNKKLKSITMVSETEERSATDIEKRILKKYVSKMEFPVKHIFGKKPIEIKGENVVERIKIRDVKTGEEEELDAEAVIICGGRKPNSGLAEKIGCTLTKEGFVKVNREQKTELEGVFCAGDVTGVVFNAVKSAGEGSTAALMAVDYLISGKW